MHPSTSEPAAQCAACPVVRVFSLLVCSFLSSKEMAYNEECYDGYRVGKKVLQPKEEIHS